MSDLARTLSELIALTDEAAAANGPLPFDRPQAFWDFLRAISPERVRALVEVAIAAERAANVLILTRPFDKPTMRGSQVVIDVKPAIHKESIEAEGALRSALSRLSDVLGAS